MAKKRLSISEYFSWLLQEYNHAKEKSSPSTLYRLVDITEKATGQYVLSFQLIGKAAIFKATPEDILNNERIIEYFSSKDIHSITQLSCKKLNQPKNKILNKIFSAKLNKLLFQVKCLNQEVVDNTAAGLSSNKEFIRHLSPEDAYILGYTTAHEKQEDEMIAIRDSR